MPVVRGRRFIGLVAGVLVGATLMAACADPGSSAAWRPCSSESFDVTALFRTFELDADDFEPAEVDRAAVCRYGKEIEDEELTEDRVQELHDALARAEDLSSDCPASLSSALQVLVVVVDLKGREENAQFNVATGDIPCESVILRGRSVAADELGELVRGWVDQQA